jgi:hypothetical protein
MDNIVKFPEQKRAVQKNRIPDVTHRYVERGGRQFEFLPWNMFLNVLIFLAGCLRTIVLTLLLFLRPFVHLVCKPLASLMLIGFIVCLFAHPKDEWLYYGFAGFSFLGFFIMHVYDKVLMLVSRGDIVRIFNVGM